MSRSLKLLASALIVLAFAQASDASFISLSASSPTLALGQSETITVLFTSTEAFNLTTASFAFTIDPTRFSLTGTGAGSLFFGGTSGGSASYTRAFNAGYGNFTINGNGAPITVGQVGSLGTYTLTALANAPAGSGAIDLQASFNTGVGIVTTQLNNNGIILTPPPTNGFDVGIDTTVTILGAAAVPEPSSLALCGIAGIIGLGAAKVRRKRATV